MTANIENYKDQGGAKWVVGSSGELEVNGLLDINGTFDLDLSSGDFTVTSANDITFQTGTAIGDVFTVQARDVDGTAYDSNLVITSGNTPTVVVQADGGATINAGLTLSDAAGTGAAVVGAVAGQNMTLTSGNDLALRSYTANSDVVKLQGYDVDGTAYDNNVVVTSGNTPTVDIQADGGIGLDGTVTVSNAAGTGAGTMNTIAGQKLTIQTTNASGTAAGADLDLIAGNGSTTGAGGTVDIDAGTGAGAAGGGAIEITAGASGGGATGNGGAVGLTAGAASSTSGSGGGVTLTAGASAGANAGGAVTLVAGQGGAAGTGGKIDIDSASPVSGNAAGGAIEINSAAGSGTGNGGAIGIVSGASGTGATGNAGDITITGGNAASTDGDGGDITITAGDLAGTGADGIVTLKSGGDVRVQAGGNFRVSDEAGTGAGVIDTVAAQKLTVRSTDAASSGNGADVDIIAGAANTSGTGGTVDIDAGAAAGANTGGNIEVNAGAGGAGGAGGAVSVSGGAPASGSANGGAVTLTGGTAGAGGGTGGEVTLTAGAAGGGSAGGLTFNGTATFSDQAGTGGGTIDLVSGQALTVSLSDNVAAALDIQESTNDYITCNTSNNLERVEIGKPLDIERGLDHVTYFEIFDDFIYQAIAENDTPWVLNSGTDTLALDPAINAQENGVIRLQTGDASGTLSADGSGMTGHIPMMADNNGMVFETRLHINTAITQCSVVAGFTDTTSLEEAFTIAAGTITRVANDAAVFVYDDGATTKEWYMCAADGGAADSGNAALGTGPTADTYQTLRIEMSSDGATIRFYIDGALSGTLSGDVGCSPDVNIYPSITFNATTTASKTLDVDYIYAGVVRG